jgi:general secretion pathway protein D
MNPNNNLLPGQTMERMLIDLIKNAVSKNSWSDAGGKGEIQFYPLGMALVVNQTLEVQEEVAALLNALRRLQDLEIAVEMRMVSVSEAFFEKMGLDFDINIKTGHSRMEQNLLSGQFAPFGSVNRNLGVNGVVSGLTPAGTLTPDLNIPIRNSSYDFSVPPFGGFPGTIGQDGGLSLGLAFLNDIQVFMFLEAAQGDRRSNIMQAPKVTMFNGQVVTLTITDQQFFLTDVQLAVPANGNQLFFVPNNAPYPLGIAITVTAVVSADRRFVRINPSITMTNLASATVPLFPVQIVVPQFFDGPGNNSSTFTQPQVFQMFFQQPTFTTISINTTVNVPDGGTVLLGGLKTLSEGRNEYGPPILGKIPYLSRLFRNTAYGRESQSLMIMVTPRIIINEEEEQVLFGQINIPRP